MIFLLESLSSFLGCIGMGAIFGTRVRDDNSEAGFGWMLSGIAHVARSNNVGWAYCMLRTEDALGIEDIKDILGQWRVFQGFVCSDIQDAIDMEDLEFMDDKIEVVSKDDLRREVSSALDILEIEQAKRDEAEVKNMQRQIQAQNKMNPGVKTQIRPPMDITTRNVIPPTPPDTGIQS